MILYFYLSLTHLALPPELHPYRLSVHHRDLLDHLPDQLIVELRVSLGVLLDTRPHLLSLRFLGSRRSLSFCFASFSFCLSACFSSVSAFILALSSGSSIFSSSRSNNFVCFCVTSVSRSCQSLRLRRLRTGVA